MKLEMFEIPASLDSLLMLEKLYSEEQNKRLAELSKLFGITNLELFTRLAKLAESRNYNIVFVSSVLDSLQSSRDNDFEQMLNLHVYITSSKYREDGLVLTAGGFWYNFEGDLV